MWSHSVVIVIVLIVLSEEGGHAHMSWYVHNVLKQLSALNLFPIMIIWKLTLNLIDMLYLVQNNCDIRSYVYCIRYV